MPSPRIVIAATQVPFERGGAEWHSAALRHALGARGFAADIVQLPFAWDPRPEVLRSALAWRLLDLTRAGGLPIDLLIATRFPSYVVRHPNKVVWLFHQFRQAYDLHDAGIDGFPTTAEGAELHRHVVALDTQSLRECRRIYTTSRNNADRLRRYNGLEAGVLRLPLLDPESWRAQGYEDFVLSVGRLDTLKRTDLLVRATPHLAARSRVVVVGEGPQRQELERLAASLGVASRVEFRGHVDDAGVKGLYARAGAVFYAPYDEDYGLVTLEAFRSRKPVLTTTDAGGPLEFVIDGETGLVTPPDPEAIGAGLSRLLASRDEARRLGESGFEAVRHIGWEPVVDALTETLR
ncbi:MAG: glycosyltransferase family 4 protein [Vicinamibacteria bacterium]